MEQTGFSCERVYRRIVSIISTSNRKLLIDGRIFPRADFVGR